MGAEVRYDREGKPYAVETSNDGWGTVAGESAALEPKTPAIKAPVPLLDPSQGLSLLATASPASLEEFFSRDPLTLSDEEVMQVVIYERRMRAQWRMEEMSGKTRASKKLAPAAPAAKASDVEI